MLANVNGTRIFFDIEGLQYVPDGPKMREKPVCFVIHGGPGSDHANFLPDTSVLSETMQLIYVDDRNCGRSDRGDITTSSMEQNVEDLEALRKMLGLKKFFILGHSYGGMKAQLYMMKYPENLHGVILAGTCGGSLATGKRRERIEQHIKEWGTPEQYQVFLDDMEFDGKYTFNEFMIKMGSLYHHKLDTEEEYQEMVNCLTRSIKNNEVNAYQNTHDMGNFNFLEDLKKVKNVPTLILSGEYDFVTDVESGRELHESIEGSEFHIVKDSAHALFSDRPDYVFPCINDFVARNFKPEA